MDSVEIPQERACVSQVSWVVVLECEACEGREDQLREMKFEKWFGVRTQRDSQPCLGVWMLSCGEWRRVLGGEKHHQL